VLEATDLPPFRAGIAAGAKLVMAGHLDVGAIDGGTPATLSNRVLVDLLRGELRFTGVVVSDAMDMAPARRWPAGEAAVRAVLAGIDLLLMPPSVGEVRAGLLEAVRSGRLPRERLIASATRILALRTELAAHSTPDMSMVGAAAHEKAALAVASAAVTVLSGPRSAGPLSGPVRITTAKERERQRRWLTEELAAAGVPVVDSGGTLVHLVGYGDGAGELVEDAAVTVAMDTPYVLADARSPVKIATYSSTRVAMRALAAVLSGSAPAPGRSPVPVPGLPFAAR
jgi:beta-N-acetylhexosaminidase